MHDIETLEIFAYNRILVKNYQDALPVYQLLTALEPTQNKWRLAQGLCLLYQKAYEKAAHAIDAINPTTLQPDQTTLLNQINQHITHYHPPHNKTG